MTPVPSDPFELLAQWLPPNDAPERPLMTLATVSADGWPNARTVLLSEWSTEGFAFHTDARSRKIAEVDATGRAALMIALFSEEASRQLVVQGTVEAVEPAEEAWVYGARPAYLQTLAWLNTPEFAALPDAERVERWAAFQRENPAPAPPQTWTGRRVRPQRLLFWTGTPDTASRRVGYTRSGEGWTVEILAG